MGDKGRPCRHTPLFLFYGVMLAKSGVVSAVRHFRRGVRAVSPFVKGEDVPTFRRFPPRYVSAPVKCEYVSAFRRFPPRCVNGVGVVKCGERLAFRRFPPRSVSAPIKCKYVSAFRRFLPRCVSAPVKCKYVSAFRRFPPRCCVNGVAVCKE